MASAMTRPRQILPGTTYLLTRRCLQRQFLLRPSAVTNAIFQYLLAVAAQRHGIRIHAYCVLSNHFHLVVTDPRGRLPAFKQLLDGLVARAVNAALGRWETFWAPASYSAVTLATPQDVLEKAAYVLANPVAAGLVRRAREWPGLWSDPARLGRGAVTVERPAGFFRKTGTMPKTAELTLEPPPGFDSAQAFAAQLEEAVAAAEQRHAASGRTFLGAVKARTQSPWSRPRNREARRGLQPRVAARDRWGRVEALGRLAGFLAEYRDAWRAWANGARDVLFPAGTYAMRVFHGARCSVLA